MTVLVTGGAGYIGGHMVLELLDAGERVVVLDDLSTGFAWAVPEGVPLIVGDFGDMALVDEILKAHQIDAVAHFAAKIVVPESVADPLLYYLNNTAKARNLLECAVRNKIKHFIFSSTAAVYGEPSVNPVNEDMVLAPINPYGRSKTDGRMDARRHRQGLWADLCRAALFQCRRRRFQGAARGNPRRRPRI